MDIKQSIRDFLDQFNNIHWGYDGDCGSQNLADRLGDAPDESEKIQCQDENDCDQPMWCRGKTYCLKNERRLGR